MTKIFKTAASAFLILILSLCFAACGNTDEKDLWADAVYSTDTEFGTGSKTIKVEVKAEDKSVTFTLNTDKETLGDALLEHKLISGEKGPYGLYVKIVNGITADYDENQSYWSLNKNGEYMQTGADAAEISDGEHYELVYTK